MSTGTLDNYLFHSMWKCLDAEKLPSLSNYFSELALTLVWVIIKYLLKAIMILGKEVHVIYIIKFTDSWAPMMRSTKLKFFSGGIDSICKNVQTSNLSFLFFFPACLLTALKWLMGARVWFFFVCLFVCSYFMPRLSLKNKWGDTFFISSFPLKKSLCKESFLFFFFFLPMDWKMPSSYLKGHISLSYEWAHSRSVGTVLFELMMGIYVPLDFCLFL